MKSFAPSTASSCLRKRAITSKTDTSRSFFGLRVMKTRPLLSVAVGPPVPMTIATL